MGFTAHPAARRSNTRVELSEHGRYLVSIRCNCANRDGEIAKFLGWIMSYIHVRRGDFLGYMRSENGEAVTLIAYPNRTMTQTVPGEFMGDPPPLPAPPRFHVNLREGVLLCDVLGAGR